MPVGAAADHQNKPSASLNRDRRRGHQPSTASVESGSASVPISLNLSPIAWRAYSAGMFFSDRLTLDKSRRNADGFMAIHARAARTGIYQYLGREIDPDGKHFTADQVVNVYRPPEEVFDKASLASFVAKPITDDHPAEGVDASNWRDLARGTIMGAAKDGEYVGFDLAFMDAETITAIDQGKRELSNGYTSSLDIEDGVAPDGTEYQAVQREIRGNHVAVVDAGRAGSSCRIGDAAICSIIPSDDVKKFLVDQRTYDAARDDVINDRNKGDCPVPKIILVDGLQLDISNVDVAEATITKLMADAKAASEAKAKAEGEVAQLTADKATLTTEVADLKGKVEASKITPAALRDAAKSYADVTAKAKALGVTVADDADELGVKRAVVDAKLGDDAKDWSDEQIAIGFTALTKDAKIEDKAADPVAAAIGGNVRTVTNDSATQISDARNKFLARKESAYLTGQPAA
jgi:uncharacterized protein